jgi:DNA-binding response OmpR family regulator
VAFAHVYAATVRVHSRVVRVLVAEDDDTLGEVLAEGLRNRGYVVDLVGDGETALCYTRCYEYSVAVLDWIMPGLSGIDVVRRLRRRGARMPVLMVSGKDKPEDRVAGLDAGADDYLVKPFDFGELLARLRALQRRPPDMLPPRLVIGDLECDPASREVRFGDVYPALTSTEMGILEMLMRFSPAVADRRQIAQHVWNNEADTFSSNTIDVHLARLRAKLSGSGARIETVRGIGYRIVAALSVFLQPRQPDLSRTQQHDRCDCGERQQGDHGGRVGEEHACQDRADHEAQQHARPPEPGPLAIRPGERAHQAGQRAGQKGRRHVAQAHLADRRRLDAHRARGDDQDDVLGRALRA